MRNSTNPKIEVQFVPKGIEQLVSSCLPALRQIIFHSDGRVAVKGGGKAKFPKRIYAVRGNSPLLQLEEALTKFYVAQE
jgi:hypothetical protein